MRQGNYFIRICLSAWIIALLTSCAQDSKTTDSLTKASDESHEVASDWMYLSLELTKEAPGFTAPVATRAFAYIGLAMYEAIVPGMEGMPTLQGQINELERGSIPKLSEGGVYNWSAVVNECMHYLFHKIYRNIPPSSKAKIDENYYNHLKALEARMGGDVLVRSKEFGRKVGEAVYAYSVKDGQDAAFMNNYPSSYQIPQGAGLWHPSNSQIKKPLQPYWGKTRMFLPMDRNNSHIPTPPAFSTDPNSEFYAFALEVRNRVNNLSVDQASVVEFWNDDVDGSISLAGHIFSILLQIIDEHPKRNLAFAARAMVRLGLCMHDATVCAWKLKYEYNLIRPETYIKENIDRDFLTLVSTPATPEYSCSQSAVAAAASEVLSELFGYAFSFTDRTRQYLKDVKGDPRSFKNFQHMLDEINQVNLMAGIHYRFSLEAGSRQGISIANSMRNLRF